MQRAPICEILMSLRSCCVGSSEAGDTPGEVSAETVCLPLDAWIASTARLAACSRRPSSSKVWEPVLSRVRESGRSNSVPFAAYRTLNLAWVSAVRRAVAVEGFSAGAWCVSSSGGFDPTKKVRECVAAFAPGAGRLQIAPQPSHTSRA